MTTQEKTGEANKKQTDDPTAGSTGTAASHPDADPELIKKLEKEKSLMHPKKQQNTMLLLNAMRTTASHSFRTFHEREAAAAAAAAATAAALSEGVAASEGQRSSATPAPAPTTSQSLGSQSSGPSASQDSAKGTLSTAKRKKKRMCVSNIASLSLNK